MTIFIGSDEQQPIASPNVPALRAEKAREGSNLTKPSSSKGRRSPPPVESGRLLIEATSVSLGPPSKIDDGQNMMPRPVHSQESIHPLPAYSLTTPREIQLTTQSLPGALPQNRTTICFQHTCRGFPLVARDTKWDA